METIFEIWTFQKYSIFREPNALFNFVFSNTIIEVSLNGGIVHVVAQFHGRTLHEAKHNVCKVDAKSFGCPMHKGNKYEEAPFQDRVMLLTKEIQLKR